MKTFFAIVGCFLSLWSYGQSSSPSAAPQSVVTSSSPSSTFIQTLETQVAQDTRQAVAQEEQIVVAEGESALKTTLLSWYGKAKNIPGIVATWVQETGWPWVCSTSQSAVSFAKNTAYPWLSEQFSTAKKLFSSSKKEASTSSKKTTSN